jgi:hypothetical protein
LRFYQRFLGGVLVFWDITSSCPLKVNRHFGGASRLPIQGRRICYARNQHEAVNKQTLKMGETCSSETWFHFKETQSLYIPKDRTLYNLYSSSSIIRMIKSRRMRWEGTCSTNGENRNAYRILMGKPEGKRPLGRAMVGGWTMNRS